MTKFLEHRQQTVKYVFIDGHAAAKSFPARADAVAADHVADVVCNEARHDRHEARVVLVIGVDHDHDVRALLERLGVAGLLVAAVALVGLVLDDGETELFRQCDRAVFRAVVHEDDLIHRTGGNVLDRALKGLFRVVGGHDDDDC